MLALLIATELWCPSSEGRHVVAFTDRESVRGSFLRSWSSNEPCSKGLKQIFLLEEEHSCHIWLELSRSQVAQWSGLTRTFVDTNKAWNHAGQVIAVSAGRSGVERFLPIWLEK